MKIYYCTSIHLRLYCGPIPYHMDMHGHTPYMDMHNLWTCTIYGHTPYMDRYNHIWTYTEYGHHLQTNDHIWTNHSCDSKYGHTQNNTHCSDP